MVDGGLERMSASLVLGPSVPRYVVSPSPRGPPSTVATPLIQQLASPRAQTRKLLGLL